MKKQIMLQVLQSQPEVKTPIMEVREAFEPIQLSKEQSSADEILCRKRLLIKDGVEWITYNSALKAMQEYAQQSRREDLINFFAWQNTLTIDETERVVDNYLKLKP